MKSALFALAATAMVSAVNPGSAQDTSLPEICKAGAMHHGSQTMDHSSPMDQAHADMMKGMDAMHADMAQGMMAEDIDVAFVCGMIPHHQGAIDMAKAELAHGDDLWVKEMAQKVIDAQTREITEMKAWLARQGQ